MKIHQLLSGVRMPVTNEEQRFIEHHEGSVKLSSLDDHDQWIAQGLVRKGVYRISKDNNTLVNNLNENNT
jgi:hypothetical protein